MALPNDVDAFLLSGIEILDIQDLADDDQQCNICYEAFAEDNEDETSEHESLISNFNVLTVDDHGIILDGESVASENESAMSDSESANIHNKLVADEADGSPEIIITITDSDSADNDNEDGKSENRTLSNERIGTGSNISTTDNDDDLQSNHELEKAVRIHKCGHIFGDKCLENHVRGLFNHGRFCPLCRTTLFREDDKEIRALILRHEVTRGMLNTRQPFLASMRQAHHMAPHYLGTKPTKQSILHTLEIRNTLKLIIDNYRSRQQELRDIRQKIRRYVEGNELTERFARVVDLIVHDGEDLRSAWQAEFGDFRL